MNSLPVPRAYAEQWISDWNRKDMDAVLSHFSDDVVFTSSRAASIMSSARLEGKAKLREYWTRGRKSLGFHSMNLVDGRFWQSLAPVASPCFLTLKGSGLPIDQRLLVYLQDFQFRIRRLRILQGP